MVAPVEFLERTRRGEAVDPVEIGDFVETWVSGGATDAQMAAWCMAVCLAGLSEDATAALTDALVATGDRLELARFGPTGDKHSTGGVGDATTLVAVPIVAALGVKVAKMSGRGLGHTGGTLDKLDAIPGMTTALGIERFVRQVRDVGIAVAGQSDRMVPGDRRLYALRDQTGTVRSHALIAASVMSKKIAGGAQSIVLDVKAGAGAFFADADEARQAAELMAAVARPWGRQVRYLVSGMEQPLGAMVGNALEVRGAADVLRGEGAADLCALSLDLAGTLAEAAGVVEKGQGRAAAEKALGSGDALRAAERWVEAQGGDAGVWSDTSRLPVAPTPLAVASPGDGHLSRLDALRVGEVARFLGAGRLHPAQAIDPAVGIELVAKVGDTVAMGEPVAWVHARERDTGERAVVMMQQAIELSDTAVPVPDLVLARG